MAKSKYWATPLLILILTMPASAGVLDSAWQFSDLFLDNMFQSHDVTFPDTMKWAWLNEAFSIMEKYAVVQAETTITIVANQRKYALPSNYVQDGIWAAYYKGKTAGTSSKWWGLMRLFPALLVEGEMKRGREITVWGDSLSVIPPPVDGNDRLYVEYAAKVDRFYSDSSTTNLPEQYRATAVNYACYKAAVATESPAKAAEFYKLWETDLAFIKAVADEIKQRTER